MPTVPILLHASSACREIASPEPEVIFLSLDASSNQTIRSFTLVVFFAITGTVPFDRPWWKLYQVDAFHVKPLPIVAL